MLFSQAPLTTVGMAVAVAEAGLQAVQDAGAES
jgi:hypothetical protein